MYICVCNVILKIEVINYILTFEINLLRATLLIKRYSGDEEVNDNPNWQYIIAVKLFKLGDLENGKSEEESENSWKVTSAPGKLFQTIPSRGVLFGKRSLII